jgi:hypothetical protein
MVSAPTSASHVTGAREALLAHFSSIISGIRAFTNVGPGATLAAITAFRGVRDSL